MTNPESDMAQPTKCVSEQETRAAYLKLVEDRTCTRWHGTPCFRDGCRFCGPVLDLIDERALECDQRGCTPRHCIYD